MTTEDALLAAVAANPADDLPRLVYADWCDENDRPVRAEFIRLQIEIAKKETLPREVVNLFAHLWQRQQELL
ncbi:MAG: TIGR02996 domain-containing protein, partial [Gemmataceae bacterium]|nr:TIGR02996 domain-containing protein [Gemmataceae bacterium]